MSVQETLTNVDQAEHLRLEPLDNQRLAALCGQCDEHLRVIERYCHIEIRNRANLFHLLGTPEAVAMAKRILEHLYAQTAHGKPLTTEVIHLHLQSITNYTHDDKNQQLKIKTKHAHIVPRGPNQALYVDRIAHHDINFATGPAGTGKTYLAVACAVQALESHQVSRILLVRPAVEAGERLGFLPGDFAQKVDPYLRPLYDALYEMLGFEQVLKYLEKNVIEIAPLAYMRGRTLNEAFIILDESQNTTKEQMKMFLTRIGFGSVAVVTGDLTQVDLPKGVQSGLSHALTVLRDVEGISVTHFVSKDVVRHPLVQKIVNAYEIFENKQGKE
jgi:phosphate starvation-inducible protein PhoH and related proteins